MVKRKKKNTHTPLALVLVFLILLFILLLLLFFQTNRSLLLLSNTTIQAIDTTLSNLPEENIQLHIEQMNYDHNKPYKYIYKKIKWSGSINELKSLWVQTLKKIPFVQIQFWKKEQNSLNPKYTVKIGTRKLIFYQMTVLGVKNNSFYTEIDKNYKKFETKKRQQKTASFYDHPKDKAKIAIVIDDVGAEPLSLTKLFLKFPRKITFAIFPLLSTTKDRAERIHKYPNFSIIIHQPMEPMRYKERHIQLQTGVLLTNMTQTTITNILKKSILSVPYAIGMNNHQGSAGTSSKRMMDIILQFLITKNFFFLDSYTTSRSIAYIEAAQIGIPYNKRDIFLDNIDTEEAVQKQLNKLIQIALKNGQAIGIGHMTKRSTINVLLKNIKNIEKQNIEFVFVKDILHHKKLVQ